MIREPSDLSSISTTSSDYQEVKDSKCPRWLKILLGVFGTLCILAAIIVPSVLIPMNNSERTQSEFDQCLQSGKDNLNYCIDSCYDDTKCYYGCYENFQYRMDNTCLWYTTSTDSQISTTRTDSNIYTTTDGSVQQNTYYYLYGSNRIINLDLSYESKAVHLERPHDYFGGQGIVVSGELYVFNGYTFYKLIDCEFFETNIDSDVGFRDDGYAVLAIKNGTSALICFEYWYEESNQCEIFNGINVTSAPSTIHAHGSGSLGFYKERPTAFGTRFTECCTGAKKVEMLNEANEWVELSDHPMDMAQVTLVGLESGALLSMGGVFNARSEWPPKSEETKDIWMLKENTWSIIGQLNKSTSRKTLSLVLETYIYLFGYELTKIEIIDDIIRSQDEIGYVYEPSAYLEVDQGFCFDPEYNNYN